MPGPLPSQDNRHLNEDYYGSSMSEQGQSYDYYMQNSNMQSYQQKQYYESVFLANEYNASRAAPQDENFPPRDVAPYTGNLKKRRVNRVISDQRWWV